VDGSWIWYGSVGVVLVGAEMLSQDPIRNFIHIDHHCKKESGRNQVHPEKIISKKNTEYTHHISEYMLYIFGGSKTALMT
jgi:hypothetical protein